MNSYPGLRWVAVTPKIAAGYRITAGRAALSSIVFHEPTSAALRDLRLSDVNAAWRSLSDVAVLEQEQPPTAEETAALAARYGTDPGHLVQIDRITEGMRELDAAGPLHRIEGESPDEFYARIARAHRALSLMGDQPTKDLARLAGVPYGTASSWISHAKKRGHI